MSIELPVPQSMQEKQWGAACHYVSLVWAIEPFFGNVIFPLVPWLSKRDEFPFVDDQGKQSLNFQLTVTCIALVIILAFGIPSLIYAIRTNQPPWGLFIAVGILFLLAMFDVVFVMVAVFRTLSGKAYRYPFAIRFIK